MDEIRLFDVPNIDFKKHQDFINFVKTDYDPSTINHDLTIVAGITERSEASFVEALKKHGFKTSRLLGTVTQLSATYKDAPLECYLTHDPDTGVVLFLTNFRKTEEVQMISDFLKTDSKSYYLFFSPISLREALRTIISDYPDLVISEFTARRADNSRLHANIRPTSKRTISYWGDDGRDALLELESAYGVITQRVVINIPGECKFGIDCKGYFTIMSGSPEYPISVLEKMIHRSQQAKRAYDTSSYHLVPAGSNKRSFNVGISKPAIIS